MEIKVKSPIGIQSVASPDPNSLPTVAPKLTHSDQGLGGIALPATPLFGTDGIRGRVGELNAPLALQVGFWAGLVLRTKSSTSGPVIVGQDSRNSSDMLAFHLALQQQARGLASRVMPYPASYLTSVSNALGG